MNLFLLAVLIITAGGILAILLARQFTLMRLVAVLGIAGGAGLGMLDAFSRLLYDTPLTFSAARLGPFPLEFSIDALAAFFLIAIFGICLLAAIYSFDYLRHAPKGLGTAASYLFFSLLAVSMALVVTAANLITFMLAWELMSLTSFFLVILDYKAPQNRKAGLLYFIFSQVGAMFILVAFALMYRYTGSFALDANGLDTTAKWLVFVFAFIGFGSKAGVFPFHVWLPHAHPAAPSHISAVMSGVMIKTGIYGILRIYGVLNLHSPAVGGMVLVFGVFAGVLGVVYALGQHDLKRLLAYHSVENIGIILIGMGIGMIGVEAQNPIMAVLGFAGASCTCSITPSSSPFFSWARAWSCIKPEPLPSTPWAVC
ncbi:proton-conducting transporter membrane subunit [Desulfosarcina cetonica]|uniref:proton-conducting transporter transmembrane domain-containing protein n=1 Tax=Desulfosarcina cetonica TaxID=90730 RepID=UPI000B238167